jgi:esterase/lipase
MKPLDLNPFTFEGGPVGCLLVHGFSGSPPEMRPMGEFLAGKGLTVLGVRLVRLDPPRVKAPVLIMQGEKDRHIPADSAQIIFEELGSSEKEIAWWRNSGHCITVDSERGAVWARAYEFIAKHAHSAHVA